MSCRRILYRDIMTTHALHAPDKEECQEGEDEVKGLEDHGGLGEGVRHGYGLDVLGHHVPLLEHQHGPAPGEGRVQVREAGRAALCVVWHIFLGGEAGPVSRGTHAYTPTNNSSSSSTPRLTCSTSNGTLRVMSRAHSGRTILTVRSSTHISENGTEKGTVSV